MSARFEFDRVVPLPIGRTVRAAAFFWPGSPRLTLNFLDRAQQQIDDAHRTPGYPREHLTRDENESLEALCRILGTEELSADKMMPEDRRRLHDMAMQKIKNALPNDPGLAFRIADSAHHFFPDDLALTQRLGNMYFDYERYVSAKPLLRQVLEAEPDKINTARRLHKCYLETGMEKRAKRLVKSLLHDFPDHRDTIMMAGYQALHEGHALDALACAEQAYSQFNHYHGAMLLKALSFVHMGKEDDAQSWFDAYRQVESDAARYGFALDGRRLALM